MVLLYIKELVSFRTPVWFKIQLLCFVTLITDFPFLHFNRKYLVTRPCYCVLDNMMGPLTTSLFHILNIIIFLERCILTGNYCYTVL